jgi:hypothetical protein
VEKWGEREKHFLLSMQKMGVKTGNLVSLKPLSLQARVPGTPQNAFAAMIKNLWNDVDIIPFNSFLSSDPSCS